jgi:plasmid stability protein
VASITICNLDKALKTRLGARAAMHGRSIEDEARDILRSALSQGPQEPKNLGAAIKRPVPAPRWLRLAGGAPRPDARAADLRRMILRDATVVPELMNSAPGS